MSPEVTAEEWVNISQAATQPGVNFRAPGFQERFSQAANFIRNKRVLGRPVLEIVADMAAGFTVKQSIRAGVMLAGTGTLGAFGAAIAAGATAGAVFAGGKEWVKQSKENWQQPLPTEAITKRQQILERLKDLKPNDWNKLGRATLRGAVVGAAGGAIGALVADIFNSASASTPENLDSPETTPEEGTASTSELTKPEGIGETDSVPVESENIVTTTPPESVLSPIQNDLKPSIPSDTSSSEIYPTSPEGNLSPLPGSNTPLDTITETPESPNPQLSTPNTPQTDISPETSIPAGPPGESVASDANLSSTEPGQPSNPVTATNNPPATSTQFSPPNETITTPDTTSSPSVETSPMLPLDTVTEQIKNLQDITMQQGDNPWAIATHLLKEVDPDHTPTNTEILKLTKIICEQNDIGVPDWGITGSVNHLEIPVGYELKLDSEVKSTLSSILKGGK